MLFFKRKEYIFFYKLLILHKPDRVIFLLHFLLNARTIIHRNLVTSILFVDIRRGIRKNCSRNIGNSLVTIDQ